MGKTYLEIFDEAFTSYSQDDVREGYPKGYFTFFRHSKQMNCQLTQLRDNIQKTEDEPTQKKHIENYFKCSQTSYNNHSFSLYLIDKLEQSREDENWIKYIPREKEIVFYSGILYRGTFQSPSDAFTNGIIDRNSSNSIEDYASDTSGGIGISTSKSESVASGYANKVYNPKHSQTIHTQYGYTYKINYRGIGGIDILETHKKRQNKLTLSVTQIDHKQEVNIIGKINPTDIMGCYDHKNKTHISNENYSMTTTNTNPTTFINKRRILFSPQPFMEAVGNHSQSQSSNSILDQ